MPNHFSRVPLYTSHLTPGRIGCFFLNVIKDVFDCLQKMEILFFNCFVILHTMLFYHHQ
jgi:hypothetical protein